MSRPSRSFLLPFRLAALLLCVLIHPSSLRASAIHPAISTVVKLSVSPTRELRVDVLCDPLAFALAARSADARDDDIKALLGQSDAELAKSLSGAAKRMAAELQVLCDEQPLALTAVGQPAVSGLRAWAAEHPGLSEPCVMAYSFAAAVPAGAHAVQVAAPSILGDFLLVVDRPGLQRSILPFDAGELSYGIDISMLSPAAGSSAGGANDASPPAAVRTPAGTFVTGWRYLALGVKHIVPNGPDHALLIVGLFLLTPRLRPLLWQVTAFTVAHCITLSLAVTGLATVPAWLVEPVIALSVALIGIENLVSRESKPWRTAVVFIFGLIHGLGFASGLAEIGLPSGQLATAVIGFGVGVEVGHLAVLCGAFVLLAWARERPWFRSRIVLPGSTLIGAIGLFWAASRIVAG